MRDERLIKILIMEKSLRQNVLIDSDYIMKIFGFENSNDLLRLIKTCKLVENNHYFNATQVAQQDLQGK